MNGKSIVTTGGKALVALSALLASQLALAEYRAGACNGCSSADMKRLATRLVSNGTASIFDAEGGRIETYRVFSQHIPGRTGRTWRNAVLIETDPVLKQAWYDLTDAVQSIGDGGVIVLPPDFPIRSVAGALYDPAFTTTGIENYLRTLPNESQLRLIMSQSLNVLQNLDLQVLDIKSIFASVTLTVVFPDGSRMDFKMEFSVNQLNMESRIELSPAGNARLKDGSPAPTSALAFRNRTFQDNGGSLVEWILFARSLGVKIVTGGGDDGTTMECKVEGSTITCRVKQTRR